jgi:DNA ligase (NAD+)
MPEIIEKLIQHDLDYFLGKPKISDTEYDKLKETARKQFPDHDYFKTLGYKPDKKKAQLPYWFVVSEKIDGVSIYVVFVDGKVEWAATRGDGYFGQDITDKAKVFCPEPKIKEGVWMTRGEATLLMNPQILGYKTKRNGCAGILNRDDMKWVDHVTAYFYEIIATEPEYDKDMETELGRMVLLERFIGQMPRYYSVPMADDEWVLNRLTEIYKDAKNREYDVDGLVITVNESVREDVEYPEKKIAFKVNEEAVEATVVGIEWQVGRTGRIVPVVLIEPLEIQGVTVSRVTGHNFQYVSHENIKPGVKIGIVRSGDVIPYITEVLTEKDGHFEQCLGCPSCGAVPRVKGVDLVCENEQCGRQAHQRLEYWLRTLGAEEITHKTLERMGVDNIPELYQLDEFSLMGLEGIGTKKAEKIVAEIQKTLHTTDAKLLQAMGIPGIARSTSKALIDYFGDIETVLMADENRLREVDGVGPILAKNIKFWQARCQLLLQQLLREGLRLETVRKESSISGLIFSMTGKLPMKRDLIVQTIEANGGIWKNSVTKKTDYLITNNPNSGSGKAKKAAKYGTKVIDFDEFERML